MIKWWLSSYKMTVFALVKDKIIIDTSPITKKFIGQPIGNLSRWMQKQGGFKYAKL
jgi:hypothetical protein